MNNKGDWKEKKRGKKATAKGQAGDIKGKHFKSKRCHEFGPAWAYKVLHIFVKKIHLH